MQGNKTRCHFTPLPSQLGSRTQEVKDSGQVVGSSDYNRANKITCSASCFSGLIKTSTGRNNYINYYDHCIRERSCWFQLHLEQNLWHFLDMMDKPILECGSYHQDMDLPFEIVSMCVDHLVHERSADVTTRGSTDQFQSTLNLASTLMGCQLSKDASVTITNWSSKRREGNS